MISNLLLINPIYGGNHYRYERTLCKNGNFSTVAAYLNKILTVLLILNMSFTFHMINMINDQIKEIIAQIISNLSMSIR